MRGSDAALRIGFAGSLATLIGIVVSGPVAVLIVEATHPQPAWSGAATFARSYHPVQLLPYLGGLVLIGGLVVLIAGAHAIASPRHAARTTVALVLSAAFASLILFNYVVQTTFLPEQARHFSPEASPIVSALSMANPRSLAWALEMWGYGVLGVATWLVAPVFERSRLERAAAFLFALNGPVSVAGAAATLLQPSWEQTTVGLVAFGAWNILLAAMAACAALSFWRRARVMQ
jgi:hypothetical protein